jgi:hypothetical protein
VAQLKIQQRNYVTVTSVKNGTRIKQTCLYHKLFLCVNQGKTTSNKWKLFKAEAIYIHRPGDGGSNHL